jgi:hypothetical protein
VMARVAAPYKPMSLLLKNAWLASGNPSALLGQNLEPSARGPPRA